MTEQESKKIAMKKDVDTIFGEDAMLQLHPQGNSMVPFLWGNRDTAYLIKVTSETRFRRGDIVLYRRSDGLLVLHRIQSIRRDKGRYYPVGDALTQLEGPYRAKDFLGLVFAIERNGHFIYCNHLIYRMLVWLWQCTRPFRPLLFRILRRLIPHHRFGRRE